MVSCAEAWDKSGNPYINMYDTCVYLPCHIQIYPTSYMLGGPPSSSSTVFLG